MDFALVIADSKFCGFGTNYCCNFLVLSYVPFLNSIEVVGSLLKKASRMYCMLGVIISWGEN
jgi:hypothetical protein